MSEGHLYVPEEMYSELGSPGFSFRGTSAVRYSESRSRSEGSFGFVDVPCSGFTYGSTPFPAPSMYICIPCPIDCTFARHTARRAVSLACPSAGSVMLIKSEITLITTSSSMSVNPPTKARGAAPRAPDLRSIWPLGPRPFGHLVLVIPAPSPARLSPSPRPQYAAPHASESTGTCSREQRTAAGTAHPPPWPSRSPPPPTPAPASAAPSAARSPPAPHP